MAEIVVEQNQWNNERKEQVMMKTKTPMTKPQAEYRRGFMDGYATAFEDVEANSGPKTPEFKKVLRSALRFFRTRLLMWCWGEGDDYSPPSFDAYLREAATQRKPAKRAARVMQWPERTQR